MADVQKMIDFVNLNNIASKSRGNYNRYQEELLTWLSVHHPMVVETTNNSKRILLSDLTLQMFQEYLITLKSKRNPEKPAGLATLKSQRSALVNLFRDNALPMPLAFDSGLKTFFKGLKRIDATEKSAGRRKTKEGKDPLPFQGYRKLAEYFLANGKVFEHLYLVMTWNLMCRTHNTETINSSHLLWDNDALGILFAKMKNDQAGERPKDPRHIYANPLMPEICPIIALGIYLLTLGDVELVPDEDGDMMFNLFPGGEQSSRFNTALGNALKKSQTGKNMCEQLGIRPTEIGAHSLRKGSGTHVSSGSIGGPSIVSICLRIGWSLGDVYDRYLRYERAGDQFVGRVVAGLLLDKHEFALLPPHFVNILEIDLQNIVKHCFPFVSEIPALFPILHFACASVINAEQYLRNSLSESHPLWQSYIFREKDVLSSLKRNVISGIESPIISATGIPPYVAILRQLHGISSSLSGLSAEILRGVSDIIEEKAVSPQTITREHLQNVINDCLSNHAALKNLQSEKTNTNANINAAITHEVFMWGGSFRRLPEDFCFPKVDVFTGWILWFRENSSAGYPPFRVLQSRDLSSKSLKKTLSDWRTVMVFLEDQISESNCYVPLNPTVEQVKVMFEEAIEEIPRENVSQKSRKRRPRQIRIPTLGKQIRALKKARKEAQ